MGSKGSLIIGVTRQDGSYLAELLLDKGLPGGEAWRHRYVGRIPGLCIKRRVKHRDHTNDGGRG